MESTVIMAAGYSSSLNNVKQLEHGLTQAAWVPIIPFMSNVMKRDVRGVPQSQVQAIAERLIVSRQAKDLKKGELCQLAGIGKTTYSNWENARGRPELDQANRLCDALGYTLDWIYRGDISGLPTGLASRIRELQGTRAA